MNVALFLLTLMGLMPSLWKVRAHPVEQAELYLLLTVSQIILLFVRNISISR